MPNDSNNKKEFNLENRTTEFAKSSGSVGANYREANDALGKKDFILRIKISRKEAKEAIHWLECLREANNETYHQEISCCIKKQLS